MGITSPQEICEKYDFKFNEIAPRFTELRNSGHIKIVDYRENERSKHKNAVYCVTTPDEMINITNRIYQELVDKKRQTSFRFNIKPVSLDKRDSCKRSQKNRQPIKQFIMDQKFRVAGLLYSKSKTREVGANNYPIREFVLHIPNRDNPNYDEYLPFQLKGPNYVKKNRWL